MQTTGNLGLKKPEGTDIVDISDLNGNMDILDNAVNSKVDKAAGKQLSTNDYTSAEKTKLAGIAGGATNYTHPATHPPTIIAQDASNRFVTDAEKTAWNAKAGTAVATTATNGLMSAADKTLLNNNTGFGTTAGTATAYTITLSPVPTTLIAGLKFSFKTHSASGANPTLNPNALGAKAIKKPNGNAATLALNGVYTVVYDGTAFILQGEGGEYGTAVAGDVLAGKTIGTENGIVTGTIPVAPNNSTSVATAYWAPGAGGNSQPMAHMQAQRGYYDGNIWISAVVPDLLPQNFLATKNIFGLQGAIPVISPHYDAAQGTARWPDGALAVYPNEGYRKGGSGAGEIRVETSQLQAAEGALAPQHIRNGISIFGVVGTLQPKLYASGTASPQSGALYQVNGLSFKPAVVVVQNLSQGGYQYMLNFETPAGYKVSHNRMEYNGSGGSYAIDGIMLGDGFKFTSTYSQINIYSYVWEAWG